MKWCRVLPFVATAAALLFMLGGCAGSADGVKVRVGVVDTGIDRNVVEDDGVALIQAASPEFDTVHGTAVAEALLIELGDGASAIALYSYPSVTASGGATMATLASGIRAAIDDDVDVLVVSLAATDPSSELEDAITAALHADIDVYAAAGNTGGQRAGYPARYKGVVSVGALDSLGAPLHTSAAHDVDVWSRGAVAGVQQPGDGSTSIAVAVHTAERVRESLR